MKMRLLLEEYWRSKDISVRNKIVMENFGLVMAVVKTIHLPDDFYFRDIVSIGNMELLRAAECYNPHTKIEFSTYAWIRIRNEILSNIGRFGNLKPEYNVRLDSPQFDEDKNDSHLSNVSSRIDSHYTDPGNQDIPPLSEKEFSDKIENVMKDAAYRNIIGRRQSQDMMTYFISKGKCRDYRNFPSPSRSVRNGMNQLSAYLESL